VIDGARSEGVGSLLRPPELLEARHRRAAGELADADFKRIEDRAVADAVRRQEEVGLAVVSDGELRRRGWMSHFVESVDGFAAGVGPSLPWRGVEGELPPEIRGGLRPSSSSPCAGAAAPAPRSGPSCAHAMIDAGIEMDNAIVAGFSDVSFGLHICRGNNQSRYYAEGDYAPLARLFERTACDRLLLEYDDARSGGFEPLAAVPEDRTVVLGLVTTKRPELESADELRRRIDAASAYVPLERLALSPQCGFASMMEGNAISPADQRRKLELVVSVARSVWG
jgi:methionine synthase II (cobalamin-independent)